MSHLSPLVNPFYSLTNVLARCESPNPFAACAGSSPVYFTTTTVIFFENTGGLCAR